MKSVLQTRVKQLKNCDLVIYVAFLAFLPVGNVRENFGGSAVMVVRHILTWNRGEYFRVVGIHSDG